VFNQRQLSVPYLQLEIGNTLGFQHAFGPYLPTKFDHLYNDPYDPMGYTGTQSWEVPTGPDGWESQIKGAKNDIWRSNIRPSSASLHRRFGLGEFPGRISEMGGG